ncbi:hypothetical protein HRM2_08400 [Desulforapulum autotrophicum HRM2]|uniref:Uncharacterized protein n=1 Tax=Desulforapulum autotrophicum (strain ATCC 43914 / DSM 3382 / VKM B-1955 / HRM2) TaxID=177437 RepID=C0QJV0_DESAH|nr:hypothetical protein HRM2_08400 [Desulforapulum autotrophicum HRM2]
MIRHPFAYQGSGLGSIGAMKWDKAWDTTGVFPEYRDFHIQASSRVGAQLTEIKYKIDRLTGGISGKVAVTLLRRKTRSLLIITQLSEFSHSKF